ncbi:MAG TPA: hypothetical protein VFV63_02240 [Ilumatobacteraceae bacterium]|nr:hypothetical protein [Ilumatobacteraceae bacterium]
MYRCKRCDEDVEDDERAAHSASEAHLSNGGSVEVDEEDYEEDPGTRGMSKTR